MRNKIYLIGIGFKPLEKKAQEILFNAPLILAFPGTLRIFKKYEIYFKVKEKIKVCRKIDELLKILNEIIEKINVVILASGDPLYFGIGQRILKIFGKEKVEIFPDLTCLQKAGTLIKENWWEFFPLSFHGRNLEEDTLLNFLKIHKKLAILTDSKNNPSKIAQVFENSLFKDKVKIWIFEKLGSCEERIIFAKPEEIKNQNFAEPNLIFVIVENGFSDNLLFGLKENEIFHEKGMITKDEVRAVVIHKLKLPKEGIFWDIGAGSGAISVECALLNPYLKVYAIEKKYEAYEMIKKNKEKFALFNLKIIRGSAPECLRDLEEPDRVFIGGSCGKLKEILEFLANLNKLKIIVFTAISLDTLYKGLYFLENHNFKVDVSQIMINRLEKLGEQKVFKALNPIFVVKAERGD